MQRPFLRRASSRSRRPGEIVGRRVALLIAGAPEAGIRRLVWAVGGLLLITAIGVIGYRFIAGFSLFD